ncbi:hypothetical protein Enr13x_32160 [Stieleria neptunia]|uniref:Uncharacterized protein n=1 Tax=Stieleria neptunia TaxID=2527979 RepID=A0A518HR81_9BACT|nr:hypothetical protein [Stieleria neptunia]QDV43360.1 hypothetical protein Enr13x_32160 [Stieleria neptunia]
MTNVRNGDQVVAESFLEVRAKLLEVAATLDRIDRACETEALDETAKSKRELLIEATKILLSEAPNRAERLQQLFSRKYDTDWRQQLGITEA